MSAFRLPRLGTTTRLTTGLTGIMISLVLVTDLLFGVLRDDVESERQVRRRVAESLSVQIAALVQADEDKVLAATLKDVVTRNQDIRSIALRRSDGSLFAVRGDHERHWIMAQGKRSTLDHVQVALQAGSREWGHVEIAFVPHANGLQAWLAQPSIVLPATLGIVGFLLFQLYLRRALQYLNPTAAVPDRVRKAFDTLSAAMNVLDPQGRLILANRAFRQLHPEADKDLHGRRLDELGWLRSPNVADEVEATEDAPWVRVLRDGKPLTGVPFDIAQPTGEAIRTMVGCSPIVDASGRERGCLVTFDDVTVVHRANEELLQALDELESSRALIEARNEELHHLATRDPLTGCFNRRAFFERANELLEAIPDHADGTLCCIMADIDHFKQVNDRHGHGVGDLVIQAVASTLSRGLRANDVLCRYGGEEFCILLPDTPLEQANMIAQRLRVSIMESAAASTRTPNVTSITSSFGLASTAQGISAVAALIDAADNALYRSKKAGRNRVTLWHRDEPVAWPGPHEAQALEAGSVS